MKEPRLRNRKKAQEAEKTYNVTVRRYDNIPNSNLSINRISDLVATDRNGNVVARFDSGLRSATFTVDEEDITREYIPINSSTITGILSGGTLSGGTISGYTIPVTSVTFSTNTYSTESKEGKEREIKNLKKRLKTERNYLTKIKLQKEITKLQNELKKQIKQEKKQNRNR